MASSLRIENCNASYDDINYLADKVSLVSMESVISDEPSRIRPAVDDTPNFDQLTELRLIFSSNVSQKIDIVKLLPSQNTMPSVLVLVIHCMRDTKLQEGCLPGQITYSSAELQNIFPHLQSLAIKHVYAKDKTEKLNFPWDKERKSLPFHFDHSDYYKHLTYHMANQTDNSKLRRILSITNVSAFDITAICNANGSLNELVLCSNDIDGIPEGCFQGLTDIHFLDISENPFTLLPADIFRNMTTLQKLYIRHTKLENLTSGMFDDLVNLDTLSIDYSRITVLQEGIFTKLRRLRILSMHDGRLESIAYSREDGTPGSLPVGSRHMQIIDLRWNKLTEYVYDCYSFPSLKICDCDHNIIRLTDITTLLRGFDPISMGLAKPLAYYGQPPDILHANNLHEVLESTVSFRDNNITNLGFNLSWHT